ncbi:MAG: hypothetical protein HOP33_17640 [Verrucomicrobia bacterium]|nr:hypothetical protein [Verrucomicrobiota bacterium]
MDATQQKQQKAKKPGRKRVLIAFALLVGIVTVIAFWIDNRSPSYAGESLDYWLRKIEVPLPYEQKSEEAWIAVRSIGTNAIPHLLREIRTKDGALKTNLIAFFERHSSFGMEPAHDYDRRSRAQAGFAVLGEDASPVVPELEKLLNDRVLYDSALAVLPYLGEAGNQVMASVLTDTNRPPAVRWQAAVNLMDLGEISNSTNATPEILKRFQRDAAIVVPALVKACRDPDGKVGHAACLSLGMMGAEPEKVEAALNEIMRDSSLPTKVRKSAAHSVGLLTFRADIDPNPYAPTLISVLTDKSYDVEIRKGALGGLDKMVRLNRRGCSIALVAIKEIAKGNDLTLRKNAVDMLEKLNPTNALTTLE